MSDVMDVDSLKSGSALRSQGDFWALHAKLGKCYEAEMAEWMARVEELEGDAISPLLPRDPWNSRRAKMSGQMGGFQAEDHHEKDSDLSEHHEHHTPPDRIFTDNLRLPSPTPFPLEGAVKPQRLFHSPHARALTGQGSALALATASQGLGLGRGRSLEIRAATDISLKQMPWPDEGPERQDRPPERLPRPSSMSSVGAGPFPEDKYAEDRKTAMQNMVKMEKVVSKKNLALATAESRTSSMTDHLGSDTGCKWEPRACFKARQSSKRRLSGLADTRKNSGLDMDQGDKESTLDWRGRLVMTPGGKRRAFWEALRMICVIIDILVIPLRFFELPKNDAVAPLSFSALAFWTLDIVVSFRTAYFEQGNLVLDSRAIACHYLRRWFFFDIFVVAVDWILVGLDGFAVAELAPEMQWLQIIRMVRIFRLLKWNQMFASLRERIASHAWTTRVSIVNIICQILLMYHVVACSFFGVGRKNRGQSWIETYDLADKDFGYQYTTTLHWALCQLGLGSNIIEATNFEERLFGIAVVLGAMITFSSLVSLMTSLLTSLHNAQEEELHQFRLLRSFLVRNQIPRSLSQRVSHFLQHSYRLQQEALSDTQVPLLSLLSKNLQGELQFERYKQCMGRLPFVDALLEGDSGLNKLVVHDIAASAVSQCVLASGEVVFLGGDWAESTLMAVQGSCSYWQNFGQEKVPANAWIAEMCLWTGWYYLGDLVTQELTVLVSIKMSSFCDTVCKSADTQQLAKLFSQDYVAALNAEQVSSDLWTFEGADLGSEMALRRTESATLGRQWVQSIFGKKKRRSSVRRASLIQNSQPIVPGTGLVKEEPQPGQLPGSVSEKASLTSSGGAPTNK
ncbi:unnamed protein product [Effrenium voratum]|uniref:Ion transport domain-containing protein n=1 Tax=Effrenium voratum TaxID=2562239 RepID=A0AA36JD24_9DINO|nr:unnamed protein product [Effrenium voratum]